MLAQFNAKQRTLGLFLNSKPTVIDKLISRNRSSILGLTAEVSEDSSDDSGSSMGSETTTSDTSTNRQVHSKKMAPVKKVIRKQVLGSKITSKVMTNVGQFKRKAGRPKKEVILNSSGNTDGEPNTSKKVINKKIGIVKHSGKGKCSKIDIKNMDIKVTKLKRKCTMKDNESLTNDTSNVNSPKSNSMAVKKQRLSASKESSPSNSSTEKKFSPKKIIPASSRALALLNATKTLKKSPVLDRWKNVMGVPGRGRPRGSTHSRVTGQVRGKGLARGRNAPYLTRSDSPIPILRNGKRRKFSDPATVSETNLVKKRKRLFSEILPKNEDFSDEQSSVFTESDYSYCESVSTPKGVEDTNREIKTESNNCDSDACDVPDNTTDTNSNVFKLKTETYSISDSNASKKSIEKKKVENERHVKKDDQKSQISTENLLRDSDGSLDSDATEDSSQNSKSPSKKKYKRRILEGLWVRRSTRSVNLKEIDNDTVAIKELLNEKDVAKGKIYCNNVGTELHDNNEADTSKTEELVKFKTNNSSDTTAESLNDFTLILEESPVKENEVKRTTKNIKTINHDQNSSLTEALNEERVKNKKPDKKKNESTNTNNNNTTKVKLENLSEAKKCENSSNLESHSELKTKSSATFLGCLQNVPEGKKQFDCKKTGDNVNNLSMSIRKHKIVKSSNEGISSLADQKTIKSDNLQNTDDENNSKCVKEEKTAKSFKTNEETVKQTMPLSTSEIENMLKNEIDSPVKVKQNLLLNSDLPATKSDYQFDNQTEDIMEENSDLSFNEILGTSISISEFANIPLSSLEDTSNPLEQVSDILNEEENCKNTDLFDDGDDVCPDEKILSLIDSFCQSDNDQMEVSSGVSNCEASNATDINQNNGEENEIELVVQGIVQSVLDKENIIEQKYNNAINEKSKESISAGVSSYFQFKQFDNKNNTEEFNDSKNELNIRTSVDSKLNMDIEDKEEDMLKACESTEESSSTDSNSHLMDLIGDPPIESMQLSGSHEDVSQSEYMDHKTNELKSAGNFVKTILPAVEENEVKSESSLPGRSVQNNFKGSENVQKVEESAEDRANKESILSALGLQSLKTVTEEKPKRAADNYTGTLKAVIKLNRAADKKSGGHKMIFKQGEIAEGDPGAGGDRLEYRICTEPEASTEGVPLTHLGDIASFKKIQMKPSKPQFDLSSSPNIVGAQTSSLPEAGSAAVESKDGAAAKESNLIIPEKSSSFSIHPGRLCSDVCSYCFGKFGSLDTPCHLAQLKNADRLNKILTTESHLAVDSCLCDGCFRYVDRKANCPTSKSLSRKPGQRRGPLSGTSCSVQGCSQAARHSVRRKWLIKLKKSIAKKLVIDMDKNPHLPFPLCSQHYYWVDYFTVCGICKKRLTRNHMYALGPEADELNLILAEDGIPVRLSDKLFLCKLCRYYSSLRLKYRDLSQMTTPGHKSFFHRFRKKILMYHDVPVSDSEDDGKSVPEEDLKSSEVSKPRKKKSKSKSIDGQDGKRRNGDKSSDEKQELGDSEKSADSQMIDYSYLETLGMNRELPETPTVDYSTLAAYEGQECDVGFSNIASLLNPLEGSQGTDQNRSRVDVKPTRIQVKFGNLNIGKLSNLNIGQDTRQGNEARCTPTDPDRPAYLPGERDLKLNAEFDFHGLPSPNINWERCTSTIQFDSDTKRLWQELQRPYGNQSSFLRHLLILEKHWRAGSLVFSEKPDPRAVKYITSVQNRVQAYEGSSSTSPKPNIPPPPPVIPLNITAPIVRPPTVSTPSSVPSSQPPPLMKIPQPWPPQDQQRKSLNLNFSMPTTQIVRPVEIQRFPAANKTSATVGPRPRKSSNNTGLGRGYLRSPGPITFQQLKRLQIQKTLQGRIFLNQPEHTVQSNNSQRPTPSPSPNNSFIPMISDVRSLATTSSTWNESFKNSYQQQTRHFPPILPKIPKALTVTQIVQPSSPVLLRNTSLTIEKASNPSSKPVAILCPEKPSISVFREPTPNGNV